MLDARYGCINSQNNGQWRTRQKEPRIRSKRTMYTNIYFLDRSTSAERSGSVRLAAQNHRIICAMLAPTLGSHSTKLFVLRCFAAFGPVRRLHPAKCTRMASSVRLSRRKNALQRLQRCSKRCGLSNAVTSLLQTSGHGCAPPPNTTQPHEDVSQRPRQILGAQLHVG